jgi:hypothetical protein
MKPTLVFLACESEQKRVAEAVSALPGLRKIWQSLQTSPDPAKSIHWDFVEIKSNPPAPFVFHLAAKRRDLRLLFTCPLPNRKDTSSRPLRKGPMYFAFVSAWPPVVRPILIGFKGGHPRT